MREICMLRARRRELEPDGSRAALRQLSTLPPVESFWGTLKTELVHHRRYETRAEAAHEIMEYIDLFYNRQRRQARLGYLSPAAYTQQFMGQQQAA